jgi:hypothetical protein
MTQSTTISSSFSFWSNRPSHSWHSHNSHNNKKEDNIYENWNEIWQLWKLIFWFWGRNNNPKCPPSNESSGHSCVVFPFPLSMVGICVSQFWIELAIVGPKWFIMSSHSRSHLTWNPCNNAWCRNTHHSHNNDNISILSFNKKYFYDPKFTRHSNQHNNNKEQQQQQQQQGTVVGSMACSIMQYVTLLGEHAQDALDVATLMLNKQQQQQWQQHNKQDHDNNNDEKQHARGSNNNNKGNGDSDATKQHHTSTPSIPAAAAPQLCLHQHSHLLGKACFHRTTTNVQLKPCGGGSWMIVGSSAPNWAISAAVRRVLVSILPASSGPRSKVIKYQAPPCSPQQPVCSNHFQSGGGASSTQGRRRDAIFGLLWNEQQLPFNDIIAGNWYGAQQAAAQTTWKDFHHPAIVMLAAGNCQQQDHSPIAVTTAAAAAIFVRTSNTTNNTVSGWRWRWKQQQQQREESTTTTTIQMIRWRKEPLRISREEKHDSTTKATTTTLPTTVPKRKNKLLYSKNNNSNSNSNSNMASAKKLPPSATEKVDDNDGCAGGTKRHLWKYRNTDTFIPSDMNENECK